MYESFPEGPLVFRPRPEARRANGFMVAFFVAFLALGWSFPAMGGERGRGFFLFMALLCTVSFGGFLGMVVVALRETREPIRLDVEGLTANGRRLAWSEIMGAEEVARPERMVVIRPVSGRRLRLRTAAYEDGSELGRVVLARAARPVDISPDEERTYRPQGLGLSAFALGLMVVMPLGLGLFLLGTPKPLHARVHPAVLQLGLMVPLVAWLAAHTLTRYVRLGPRELTVGSVLGRRTIALASVDAVEATEGGLLVRSSGRRLLVPKGFTGHSELRDRLLALSPRGVVVPGNPEPVASTEARVFAPRPGAWVGPMLMGAALLGFAVWGTFVTPALLVMLWVPGGLGLSGLWGAAEATARYSLDEEGIERRSVFGASRLRWEEIDLAWREGPTLEGYTLRSARGKIDVHKDFVQDLPALRATLDARLADARARAVREAEGRAFGPDLGSRIMFVGVLSFAGVGMVIAGIATFLGRFVRVPPGQEAAAWTMGGLWLLCGLGLVLGATAIALRRYVPTVDGLEARSVRGRRFLRWADVRRAESGTLDTNRREHRRATLTLEHPEGSLRIDGMIIGEFDRLKGYVLTQVDPAVVRESGDKGQA